MSKGKPFHWNARRDAILRKLWYDSITMEDIAKKIGGGCTKQIVKNREQRLGLPNRRHMWKSGGQFKKQQTRVAFEEPRQLSALFCEPVSILELKSCECAYPVRPHLNLQKGFCGAQVKPGKRYCDFHYQICYPPRKASSVEKILDSRLFRAAA